MEKQIFVIQTKADLERCYPIMKELRPHLSFEDYISIYEQSHESDGCEIVAIEQNNQILAVMGYRFLSDYVRGKHIYVDDLVCTGIENERGVKFYDRNGWTKRAYAYTKKLSK